MNVEQVSADERLRIAVLGDFAGVHTRSWLRWFIDRGHEMHAVSFYPPRVPLEGVVHHSLRKKTGSAPDAGHPPSEASRARRTRGFVRLAHGARYRMAGLRRVVRAIAPDVFHAHFVVEHGFYGALAGVHPYVVTAWGSDVLVEPQRDPVSRMIARWTIGRADAITSNNAHMAEEIRRLGASADKVHLVTLGADAYFLDAFERSVNVQPYDGARAPVVLCTRAHEPLYNIADIIDAFQRVETPGTAARLVIAHQGSLTSDLRRRADASAAAGRVDFAGMVDRERLRDLMSDADVFVSVPSSDGTSVALLQAMAAGCFPIVSDLATQHEWIQDGVNGRLVPLHDSAALAAAITESLAASELRRRAADVNRRIVTERGLNETQMAKMEGLYRRLARR